MKKNYFLHLTSYIFLLFLLTSCGSVKNVAYLQNSDYIDLSRSEYLYDAHIMPKDVLTITVSTVNPEASAPFNLIVHPTLTNTSNNISTSGGSLQTYLVDNKGLIDFPVLGSLQVGGLSKSECEKMIHDKLLPYLNATENPVVTVRMSNYKISVLGEVNKPGMFTVSNEKINILEALAQAGDLTIYGVRDKVKLIRENASGKKEIIRINLNDAEIINSPYYYLQQNDIVYVTPNAVRAGQSTINENNFRSVSFWMTMGSTLVTITNMIILILTR